MQTIKDILFSFFLLNIIIHSYNAHCEVDSKKILFKADSFFVEKKYSDAYPIYYKLFNTNIYTPQTILKMAFIKEAWGESVESLYFLNYFYEKYPEKKVFKKMKDLADKEKLEGYKYSDFEFFLNLYRNFHNEILLVALGFVFLFFLYNCYRLLYVKRLKSISPFFLLISIILLLYFLNLGETYINPGKEIVLHDKSLLMDGPSAGAKVVGLISKGERIMVLEEIDIWAKIKTNYKSSYVRKSNLKL